MSKKAAIEQAPADTLSPIQGDTLPIPFDNGVSFTPAQVFTTGERILGLVGWVPVGLVIPVVAELLELASDEDMEIDGSRFGNDKEAARYALLAARLISAYEVTIIPGVQS
jgi:hypothetical protein